MTRRKTTAELREEARKMLAKSKLPNPAQRDRQAGPSCRK